MEACLSSSQAAKGSSRGASNVLRVVNEFLNVFYFTFFFPLKVEVTHMTILHASYFTSFFIEEMVSLPLTLETYL